jgi:hypothetical protein
LTAPARVAAAVVWFGALAGIFAVALGGAPDAPDRGAGSAETLALLGFFLASVLAGAVLGAPALAGPPSGVALLFALYAVGVELPVFVSSALWAVGAAFLAVVELLGAGAGIAGRAIFLRSLRA